MKFITFEWNDEEKYGIANDEEACVWDIASLAKDRKQSCPASLLDGIAEGETFIENMNELIKWASDHQASTYLIPYKDIKWRSPIPQPRKNIICVGKNYRDHAIEMGSAADIPTNIMVFTKAPTTVIGHNDIIDAHQNVTNELDYEGELAVIIGKQGKNIPRQNVMEYVFGYTIVNDITARDLQKRHKQFFIGKSLDTSCPIGPWIVHKDSIKAPDNLQIRTKVNGELRQQSNTEHFIFPIEEIISVLSQGMTLEPGDIIATGTPAGVGKGFKPPRFLKSGDEIEIEIENIGKLYNIVK